MLELPRHVRPPAPPQLAMRRRAARQPQLAADVACTLDERDGVAVRGGLYGRGDSGGAGAYDQHAQRAVGAGAPRQRALAAGARVDDAADRDAGVVVADAGLVAADAGEHVGAAAAR